MFQILIFPGRLDSGFPNRFRLPKLRFEQVSNPNFSRLFGLRISKSLDYPNWDLRKFQIPIFPDRLDSGFSNRFELPKLRSVQVSNPNFPRLFGLRISKLVQITQLRFEQVSNPIFPRPFGLRISKSVRITQIEIWASFKSQFSPTVWTLDFQIGSDYPNWDLSKFQITISPDHLDWGFPNRFRLPKLRSEQV